MLQAKQGRCGKQQQEVNPPNLGPILPGHDMYIGTITSLTPNVYK